MTGVSAGAVADAGRPEPGEVLGADPAPGESLHRDEALARALAGPGEVEAVEHPGQLLRPVLAPPRLVLGQDPAALGEGEPVRPLTFQYMLAARPPADAATRTSRCEPAYPLFSTASTASPASRTITWSCASSRSGSGRSGSPPNARTTSAAVAPVTTVTVAACCSSLRRSQR